jgi:membrane associated rhomboid family serine protease
MKIPLARTFSSIPIGMRVLLLIYAFSFPVIQLGLLTHTFDLPAWVGLSPALVWKGQIWRVLTYGFFARSILAWGVNSFWLITLVIVLRRDWSSTTLWSYYVVAAIASAVPILLLASSIDIPILSWGGEVFALLIAWAKLYGRERIVMLGFGEVSVRQAATFVAALNAVIIFFSCGGWLFVLSMLCGGLAGWAYLAIGSRRVASRGSQVTQSDRIARLEL